MTIHETYMRRCLQLAKLGAGNVAPNPMVGSVLVYESRIIGEGYHRQYGQAHAEVNCINSVKPEDQHLIAHATIYVSLEPCVHFGKTPPCADLIIAKGIRKVVIGCRDPFEEVNGKGIEKLQAAGIEVINGVLEKECHWLNRRFFTYHTRHRPYILLKWAQTANGKMAVEGSERLLISGAVTNRLVHRWRSEESAILVGTRTAMMDNPSLTNRYWSGSNPVRLVVDRLLQLPANAALFSEEAPLVVFNEKQNSVTLTTKFPFTAGHHFYYQVSADTDLVEQIVHACYHLRLQSVLVEGGARLLQSFIDTGNWDEARVITNRQLHIAEGLQSPQLAEAVAYKEKELLHDHIQYYIHPF